MTRPRQVLPGRFYLITRRCAGQQMLLHPDPITVNAFEYCLAHAAELHRIDVLGHCAMSNHYHAVIFDRYGNYPAFLEYFHLLVARSMNTRWRRKDCFWSGQQTSVVWLPTIEAIVDELVYVFTNPVGHLMVEHFDQWPGTKGYAQLMEGTAVRRKRPNFFFRADTGLPDEVHLKLEIPPELGDRDAFLERVANATRLHLRELADERRENHERCMGRRWVLEQPHTAVPAKIRAHTRLSRRLHISPTFASKDSDIREQILDMRSDFLTAYYEARDAWLAHEPCEFPVGTYWLGRRARASVPETLVSHPVTFLEPRPPQNH
ncbi:MAG TPA: hypothetical protein VFQ53_03375 [Kofleriaceae bacterium]|nr:hypothetical protein [Kofleriaceae bacterium]